MDSHGSNGDQNDMWPWRNGDYGLHEESSLDMWVDVNQNVDNLFHMLDEQTPIKDCSLDESSCQASNLSEKGNMGAMMELIESSQIKRRRMLQFNLVSDETIDSVLMEEGLSENLDWNEQWNFKVSEGNCVLNCGGLDEWLDECLVDGDTNDTSGEEKESMPLISSGHAGASIQKARAKSNAALAKVSKGKKTLISVPSKLSSSVAYPFALVKPCGGHGDLTLNDINQRIHAPPRSKLKHKVDADGGPYTTSAFSGKPVVGRTKIRTEGGRGSITIMRTRG
ncbi:protein XRI1-like isoform X2 [Carex rostrata]